MAGRNGLEFLFPLLSVAFAVGAPAASARSAATWSIVPSPAFLGVNLQSVSCTGPTSCSAVGILGVHLRSFPVAEQWDGRAWTEVDSPNEGAIFSGLSGVSCVAAADCAAVGGGLVEHWDGRAWTLVTHPERGGLAAVSCDAAADCVAVGTTGGSSGLKTYAERWDGTAWTVVPTPTPPGASFSQLFAVSCTPDHKCSTAGTSDNTALIEMWDGTAWTIVPVPVPSGATSSALNAVSCLAATDCTAVGDYHLDLITERALIERWNGTTWTSVPSAGPVGPDVNGDLYGVSCTTPIDCTAVGASPATGTALIEQWDGTAWMTVPDPDAGPAGLRAVSCTSPASCTAVGSNGLPMIEHSDTANATITALTVTVNGSQPFGSSNPSFATSTAAPPGDRLTGALTCTTVGNPATTISPILRTGTYPLNGASCSGLTLSGPTAAHFQIGYTGGIFIVTPGSVATTIVAPASTTTVPSLAFTGEATNVPLSVAAGLVAMSLACRRIRRRSDHAR